MQQTDIAIIGGGIVGLATAYRLLERFPGTSLVVVEKENDVAQHQTGHNSGVLHSGIYYRPGSLKAINCREGNRAMREFCDVEGIKYDVCGKVIVAVGKDELPALEKIYERGQANQVRCTLIDRGQLNELEPYAAGIRAIHVPDAGIVDFTRVCQRLAERIRDGGATISTGTRLTGIARRDGRAILRCTTGDIAARLVVNCAGLYCDRVTRMSGIRPAAKILPFRGEYFELRPEAIPLVKNLIYPVPDPSFPFLGVHFTRMIDGSVECGPNAVLAMAREGYSKTKIDVRDLVESLTYSGFLRMAAKYWRVGAAEMWRSLSKQAFVRALRRLVPDIRSEHLVPAPAGVRAQAVMPDGAMVDDFLIHETENAIHVLNAPSPAATASLNIGTLIVDKLAQRMRAKA
ncbi:MAG: L-2-hydroxyglutarate oxidase [Pirellulales bacterium]